MALKDRVLAVVAISTKPMSTHDIAEKIRVAHTQVSGTVSKLHMYGLLEAEIRAKSHGNKYIGVRRYTRTDKPASEVYR